MSKPKITLMLVDDQHLFREGIKSLLKAHEEVQVVAEAADGQTALDLASREAPDVILLDLKMPGMDGMECCRRLKEQTPSARIVILTVSRELASIVEAMKSGASGYLTKDTPSEKVVETVIRVYHEGNLLEPLPCSLHCPHARRRSSNWWPKECPTS
jgi:DNA-binding NarL/FixJ family response regulator